MATTRSVDFLPEIFQTPVNKQFLAATLDQLVQEPKFKKNQGFIGRRIGPGVNANDRYVVESTAVRNNYQLEPGVCQINPENTREVIDAITYPGINDALALQGAVTTNPDALYTSDYYTWDPFVDFDKFINYAQYYWVPDGPDPVAVNATGIPTFENFTVTRNNGFYSFSGVNGSNPTLTLARTGTYNFEVAQNESDTIQYRVINDGTTAWLLNYDSNPTLTLVRGNTYVFTLSLTLPLPFYIKTELSFGNVNLYNDEVTNNGAVTGTIRFTVPQNAPDTLFYCSSTEFNMRGQFNIINGTPGTGANFWIQTHPGVAGQIPATPNISNRLTTDNGVTDNGIDLGTITFEVPTATDQDFYYNLPLIGNIPGQQQGTVDLVTGLDFAEIDAVSVDSFFTAYPTGIDGITNLQNRTLIFDTTTDLAASAGVWLIDYVDVSGTLTIQLTNILTVTALSQLTILFGTQYASTRWYKDADDFFVIMPLLAATLDVLYYQDSTNPVMFGTIQLVDVTEDSVLNIDNILGNQNYSSPNGVTFTNGMKVLFDGATFPTSFQGKEYYVEGVGTGPGIDNRVGFIDGQAYFGPFHVHLGQKMTGAVHQSTFHQYIYDTVAESLANFGSGGPPGAPASTNNVQIGNSGNGIRLLPVTDFVTPETYLDGSPIYPDYITVNRASLDRNPWTRSNRWFHVDVLNVTAEYNKTASVLDQELRSRRPILEFRAGTRLFNFGTQGLQAVDIVDFSQTNALRTVNGTIGFSTDGYTLVEGSLVIFAGDSDIEVRNKIYQVEFVSPDTVLPLIEEPIINLLPVTTVLFDQDTVSLYGDTVAGISYRFDGVDWLETQQKTSVNQPPQFDIFDANGISFGDDTVYPSTNFDGSSLFSYALGNGINDVVLGFPLTYLNLTNIGDIVFSNNLYADSFNYTTDSQGITVALSTGFVRQYSTRLDFVREIGWQDAITQSQIRQQFRFVYDALPIQLDVAVSDNTVVPAIQIFINAQYVEPYDNATGTYNYTYITTANTTSITLTKRYVPGDLVELQVLSDQTSATAFYQVPINLENNPFNSNSSVFTLGTARNHYSTIGQNLIDLQGPVIGANNSRDLGNLIPYGLQILQQGSPLSLTGYFLRSEQYNIFSALQFNSREYIKFKSLLLNTAITNDFVNLTVPEILDRSVAIINAGDTSISPFYWSDMMPTGSVFVSNSTTVNPITTARFNTVQTYDFTSANYLGLVVYINDVTLTRGVDYVVGDGTPTLTILVPLVVGDVVTVNEYNNTAGNFVPNTPTKLGLYPKFVPRIYLDNNYVRPTLVIQGHDGSITVAFGDIRDQVLLEFEKRIYSNLKTDGNPVPLTVDEVLPGFFRTTDYTEAEITRILGEDFLIWAGLNKLDYTTQDYIATNEFTYNYSTAGNRINNEVLSQGAWRGIYRYFYDTMSPDTTPWEMLGFSEQPIWWEDRYGPAPYTSDNLVLWGDLEQGLVFDPVLPYVKPNFARPGLTLAIPVDSLGQLLPPLESVVGLYNPNNFRKSWAVGDGGPVEASWWMSSSYPFAVMRLLALTRPAEFFSLFADRDLYRYNDELGQYLYNNRYRLDGNGLEIYGNGVSKASYINWIVDYNQQQGLNSTDALTTDLANLDVRLCYRVGAWTNQQYLEVYLEKSSPESENQSLQIPPESYNLLVYKDQPFAQISYSAVVVETTSTGWAVYGYGTYQPYFPIVVSSANGITQTISAGGATVTVPAQYTNNVAFIPYGYVFTNRTMMVDFLLSYGKYLESQGMSFTQIENGYVLNWPQMAQEFLYFSQQGWQTGTLINLNPAASQLTALRLGSVVDSIYSYSPENVLLDQNRQTFATRDLIIQRDGDSFQINPAPTTNQAISFLNLRFTDYENIIIFDNVDIFNDLIYDPATGARQNRLYLNAVNTVDWNGTLDAQGFILNNDNVKAWNPNQRYTKGEIVRYKNNYWQASGLVQPKTKFDYNDWFKSNWDRIEQGLLPNIANKADQLANAYNTQTANLNNNNDLLAYNLIGFTPRQYMSDLNLDDVSQVNLYQQFIKTKGTTRATDLFTRVNLTKESGDYKIYETWGVLVGTYGANANRSYFELNLNEARLTSNPSTVQVVQPGQISQANQTILLSNLWRESYKITNTDILPTIYPTNLDTALPWAGYVNVNDADITVYSLDDPSSIAANLDIVGNGTSIWVAHDNSYSWNIYRCTQVPGRLIQITDNLNSTSIAQFSSVTGLVIGDLVIVRLFANGVDGVYRVLGTPSPTQIIISYSFVNNNQTILTGTGLTWFLQTMRVAQASDVASLPYANQLIPGARAWVDNDGSGHWEVLEKQDPFVIVENKNASIPQSNSLYGASVAQSTNQYSLLVGSPDASSGDGAVYTYRRVTSSNNAGTYVDNTIISLPVEAVQGFGNNLTWGDSNWAVVGANTSGSDAGYAATLYQVPGSNDYVITQLLTAPTTLDPVQFGTAMAISHTERWMYISAPVDNLVYAYGKVDVPAQSVTYFTDGITNAFDWSPALTIDPTGSNPEQLIVTVNNQIAPYPADYIVTGSQVRFFVTPVPGVELVITRRTQVGLTGTGGANYNLEPYLYTATNIDSFIIQVDNVLQRPYIDYNFTTQVEFEPGQEPAVNASIVVITGPYWQYIDVIPISFLIGSVAVTGSLGQFSCTSTELAVGTIIDITGTLTGTATISTYPATTTYYVIATNGSTTFTLSATAGGSAITTTAGTTTGLTFQINAVFGTSLSTSNDGRSVSIGCELDTAVNAAGNIVTAGSTYVFDRSVVRYLVTDTAQTTYLIPGSFADPVAVLLNNEFLTNTNQYSDGQFTISGSNVVLSSSVALSIGDSLEIETNQFQLVQKLVSQEPQDGALFGHAVQICSNDCSVYIGAPHNTADLLSQSGSVERQINQSQLYGVIASTIANPALTAGSSIRINNVEVVVPNSPRNTVAGLAEAISPLAWSSTRTYYANERVIYNSVYYTANSTNTGATPSATSIFWDTSFGIPNMQASATNNLQFTGDGVTKIFSVGSIYTTAGSVPTVYVNNVLQVASPTGGYTYTYNNTNQQIEFVTAPVDGVLILAVSGRLILAVINATAADEFNKLSVLPGVSATGSAFAVLGFDSFVYAQTLYSPNPSAYAFFGTTVAVNNNGLNIVVGASNGNVYESMPFDGGETIFDDDSTIFNNLVANSGVAYTFDYLPSSGTTVAHPGQFVFGQQIYQTPRIGTFTFTGDGTKTTYNISYVDTVAESVPLVYLNNELQIAYPDANYTYIYTYTPSRQLITFNTAPVAQTPTNPSIIFVKTGQFGTTLGDQFGAAVDYVNGRLIVGAPGVDLGESATTNYGSISIFDNPGNTPSWVAIHQQQPAVNIELMNSVYTFDKLLSNTQTYFDFIDPLQGKILGVAARNINYIGAVDPANYNTGTIHNNGTSWGSTHLGEIWWDTDTVRFIDPNQDNITYASKRWGQIFPGSRVDIYQWIESSVPPANYVGVGTPLSTTSYTVSSSLTTSGVFATYYYYWVRGISTIDTTNGKNLSTTAIASYITNPIGSGIPYIAPINSSTVALYNAIGLISAQDTILHVEYEQQVTGASANIHTEYQFIADGRPNSFLNDSIYQKMLDSFCGADQAGNSVPDPFLSPGMRYGVQFRPRQSMFINRFSALENYLTRANSILAQFPITEIRSFNLLNSSEPVPVATTATGTSSTVSGNVLTVAGTVTGVFAVGQTITGTGIPALVTILALGTGTGSAIGTGGAGTYIISTSLTLGARSITGTTGYNQTVDNLTVLGYQNLLQVNLGYRYLVLTNSDQGGRWTINEVVNGDTVGQRTTQIVQIQNYDTTLYWDLINWYLPGYNSSIQPIAQVTNTSALQTLSISTAPIGSSVKVTNNGRGKFEIYIRTVTGWDRVGLEDGTIAFDEVLWNYALGPYGYDAEVFDAQYFDQEPTIETRKIIQAINQELFIDDLLIYRNQLLILTFKFIYSEFASPDWLIKTSFIDVDHNLRALLPYQLYLRDNQTFVEQYLQEVKPFHVQTLAFNLIYNGLDLYPGQLTDFDVPAYWNNTLEIPQFVSPVLTPYTDSGSYTESFISDAEPNAAIWAEKPWNYWFNNYTLGVTDVIVLDGGADYATLPAVTFGTLWEPSTVYTVGQQLNYINGAMNNLYTVTVAGTSGTVPPLFTSGSSVNGTTTMTYAGTGAAGYATLAHTIGNVAVTGTAGQFSCDADTLAVGTIVVISGTLTGNATISTYPATTTYYVIATNTATTFTLSTTADGTGITTTAGTTTGLTFQVFGYDQVVGVTMTDPGTGYVTTTTVTFTSDSGTGAAAYPVMTNSLVRNFSITLKFDRYQYATTIFEWIPGDSYVSGDQVRYRNVVWEANQSVSSTIFDPSEWDLVDASTLTGVDRTMGYYTPTPNMPGLSLPLLIDGVNYPGVQVSAPTYDQDSGFDVGGFSSNPFDNVFFGPEGRPTYDPGILDVAIQSSYLGSYLGTSATDIEVDGGGYIDVFSSYAPEELVPGSEFDTLDFRVFTTGGPTDGLDFRIFQDMQQLQATYVITQATTTELAQAVSASADIIYVNDATALTAPDPAINQWGVITIDAERIMYREIDYGANTVSSLIRGTAGTAATAHSVEVLANVSITGNISSVAVTGTAGQFSCTSNEENILVVGTAVLVTGTLTGTATISTYPATTTYYVIATNGSTTFTLSATAGGSAVTTTAGTTTGLAFQISGQFTCSATTNSLVAGQLLIISGTNIGTGSITGYSSPTTYRISQTTEPIEPLNNITFVLTNTDGTLVTTTAGTPFGLTYDRTSAVYNASAGNLLGQQFQNYIVQDSELADGSTTVFTAPNITLSTSTTAWTDSITYNAGDIVDDSGSFYRAIQNVPVSTDITDTEYWQPLDVAVEVYVGGIRLSSDFYTVTAQAPVSVTLDTAPESGVDVTILIRRGTWVFYA